MQTLRDGSTECKHCQHASMQSMRVSTRTFQLWQAHIISVLH